MCSECPVVMCPLHRLSRHCTIWRIWFVELVSSCSAPSLFLGSGVQNAEFGLFIAQADSLMFSFYLMFGFVFPLRRLPRQWMLVNAFNSVPGHINYCISPHTTTHMCRILLVEPSSLSRVHHPCVWALPNRLALGCSDLVFLYVFGVYFL